MGKFFCEDIPDEIVRTYKNMVRRESYRYKKDALSHARYFGSEDELYKYGIDKVLQFKAEMEQRRNEINLISMALELLKERRPDEYEIIHLYYFSGECFSLDDIGRLKCIKKQTVHYHLGRAYKHLKEYVMLNKI